jgi:hypothetical protein
VSAFLAKKVVSSLPGTLTADTIYFVRVGDGFDIYVTNTSGMIVAYPLNPGSGGPIVDPLSLLTEYSDTTPSSPASGVTIFSRALAGRRRLAYVGPSGLDTGVQAFLGSNKVGLWTAQGNGTTISLLGMANSASGNATSRNVANTNRFTMMRRIGYGTTGGQVCGTRHGFLQFSRAAGFEYIARCGLSGLPSGGGYSLLVGLVNVTTAVGTIGSTISHGVGLHLNNSAGWRALSAAATNDTPTVHSSLSTTTFPVNTANVDMYEIRLFCPPGGNVGWSLTRLTGGTGQVVTGVISTALPAANTLLSPIIHGSCDISAAGYAIDVVSQYIESDL